MRAQGPSVLGRESWSSYERAIMESDHQAKRKFPAADEEDLTKRVRVGEESTTTFPSSSSSSTSHRVVAESTVTGGEQRGEKRAAEDPPADCGQEDSVGQNEELRAGDGTSMECLSFQEYCDSGGLWMIACREPEEDLEETQDEPVPIATEQGCSSRRVLG